MNDKTEILKEYWESEDLTFIARFDRYQETEGFFNYFLNPFTKQKIFYPQVQGIKIDKTQVSFYVPKAEEYIDKDYYKIELRYTTTPKGKQNPFSLEIYKVSSLDQIKIQEYLKIKKRVPKVQFKEDNRNMYYGQYEKRSDKSAVFINVMYADTGNILIQDGELQKVYVSPSLDLIEGGYYSFYINENQRELPNAINTSVKHLEVNPYKKYLDLRFSSFDRDPKANTIIAKLMREIGKGMYDSKQRMIFELLQNADDSPIKNKVEFTIDISGDYFCIMHDGAPFSKDDIEAITSAAESTKRDNNKKTGYKGIGFKSVFTDSSEVWLKSGGYQFAFLRQTDLYSDFDKFYFSSIRYKENPKYLEEDLELFKKYKKEFNPSTDIPWQLIPIWKDTFPIQFSIKNNNVQFALKIGSNNIVEYKQAIDDITKRPQFLLFLRNTSKFESLENGVKIFRSNEKEVIRITKQKKEEINVVLNYTKISFSNIEISDSAFMSNDIKLKKQLKKNDYGEEVSFFSDLQDNEIETIPPKLASSSETEISFGISIVDNKISVEKGYLEGSSNYSSLFTYLPMEDTRFQLPFLVNADFVPSSNRQKIQGDNLWNKYIIIKIAEKHVETIADLAKKFQTDVEIHQSYLSLLLKELIAEDDTAQMLIDSYNNTYLSKLETEKIVVNSEGDLQTLDETIIDSTGLAKLFGADTFYSIFGYDKKLPHADLDYSFLSEYEYLDIECVDWDRIYDVFKEEHCLLLGDVIERKKLYDSPRLLQWLDQLALHSKTDFYRTPFVFYKNKIFSLIDLLEQENVWVINKNTSEYESLLENIGFQIVNLNINKYTNINNKLDSLTGYINDKTETYERIAANENISNLIVEDKVRLIQFFQESSFMQGIGETKYFGSLELFVNQEGIAMPLKELIDFDSFINVETLDKHKIREDEYHGLTDDLKKQLIKRENVFTSFVLNLSLFNKWTKQFTLENIDVYIYDLKSIFQWNKEEEISQSRWAEIPWIYVDDKDRFTEADNVYWSKAFNKLTNKKYTVVKDLLEKENSQVLTLLSFGEIIDLFSLKVNITIDFNWSCLNDVSLDEMNVLLDWMEQDGSFNDFFESYYIQENIDYYDIKENTSFSVYDGTNIELKQYIDSIKELDDVYFELPSVLYTKNRYKLGLLQSEQLILSIIESKDFNQDLVLYLASTFSNENFNRLVLNLGEFVLSSSTIYKVDSPESIIISKLLKQIEDVDNIPMDLNNIIEDLREKIVVDSKPLSDYDLSNRVIFGKADNRKVLQLSDILNDLQGDSDILDNLIESFVSITNKGNLRKVFFRTRQMSYYEIYSKIETSPNEYYSVDQVIFQILDKQNGNKRNWSKKHFDDYYSEQGDSKRINELYIEFLDKIFEAHITELTDFVFYGFNLNNCVDENFAIEQEVIPNWLQNWLAVDQVKRTAFLEALGYNGAQSSIVSLRKAMSATHYNKDEVIRYYEEAKKVNSQVIWNTVSWLSKFKSDVICNNIEIVQRINDNNEIVQLLNDCIESKNVNKLTIPIIESINDDGKRIYCLKEIDIKSNLWSIPLNERFNVEIYKKLKNSEIPFVDEYLGKLSKYFSVEIIELSNHVDFEKLISKSKLWDEVFYQKWEYYEEYPVYIYDGKDMPYLKKFKEHIISDYTYGISLKYEGKYFISKAVLKDILANLPKEFPNDKLESLRNWHYETLRNESLLEEDSFEYNENIDRLLQDRLGISKEEQKRESGNAKTHAVYFLEKNGFDVSDINNNGAALTRIKDPEGTSVSCIVRSAKGGLLYLDKEHWDMMQDDFMYLIVIYPGNTPRLFKDRIELLEEEFAENVLFRIPNSKHTSEIDNVFNYLESESHLILVTSEKMKESLFSKIKKSNTVNKQEKGAIAKDNFEL